MRKQFRAGNPLVGDVPPAPADLKEQLKRVMPSYLVPGNVGGLDKSTWPFWFNMDFTMPAMTMTSTFSQKQGVQVDQEAGFLLMATSVAGRATNVETELYNNYDFLCGGGDTAPNYSFGLQIQDRASTRLFSNIPLPLQFYGTTSKPNVVPVPMYFPATSSIDGLLSYLGPVGSFGVTGVSDFTLNYQVTFFGYRIRQADAESVLSSIYT